MGRNLLSQCSGPWTYIFLKWEIGMWFFHKKSYNRIESISCIPYLSRGTISFCHVLLNSLCYSHTPYYFVSHSPLNCPTTTTTTKLTPAAVKKSKWQHPTIFSDLAIYSIVCLNWEANGEKESRESSRRKRRINSRQYFIYCWDSECLHNFPVVYAVQIFKRFRFPLLCPLLILNMQTFKLHFSPETYLSAQRIKSQSTGRMQHLKIFTTKSKYCKVLINTFYIY